MAKVNEQIFTACEALGPCAASVTISPDLEEKLIARYLDDGHSSTHALHLEGHLLADEYLKCIAQASLT